MSTYRSTGTKNFLWSLALAMKGRGGEGREGKEGRERGGVGTGGEVDCTPPI